MPWHSAIVHSGTCLLGQFWKEIAPESAKAKGRLKGGHLCIIIQSTFQGRKKKVSEVRSRNETLEVWIEGGPSFIGSINDV